MSSRRGELYQKLFNTCKMCYPEKKSTIVQESVNKIWNDLKQEYKSDGKQFEANIQNNIETLNQKITQNKASNLTFSTSIGKSSSFWIWFIFTIIWFTSILLAVYIIITILNNFYECMILLDR